MVLYQRQEDKRWPLSIKIRYWWFYNSAEPTTISTRSFPIPTPFTRIIGLAWGSPRRTCCPLPPTSASTQYGDDEKPLRRGQVSDYPRHRLRELAALPLSLDGHLAHL